MTWMDPPSTIHRKMGTSSSLHLLQQRADSGGQKKGPAGVAMYCSGRPSRMVLGGGWVEWKREIRIKEVFIGWVEEEEPCPKGRYKDNCFRLN